MPLSHSTNKNAHSTTKSRRFIMPLSRFEERGNHLALAGEDLCKSLDFLTRVCLENVWDSGEGENRVDSRCNQ